jgi:transitional endoplasmic reticulum ATPase
MIFNQKFSASAKKDVSQAILQKKKAPNKLTVEDSKNDDNTIIEITEKKMEELNLMRGDQVLLKGKKRRETVCIAFTPEDPTAEDG